MVKKNTLLYLDEDLVKLAKKLDLNISQITEMALKSRILPMLPSSERRELERRLRIEDFDNYLEDLKKRKMCFFLRIGIKGLQLKNIGPFDDEKFSFTRGLNVVYGLNGSGKTTILNSILEAFGYGGLKREHSKLFEDFFGSDLDEFFYAPSLKYKKKEGEIKLRFYSKGISVKYSSSESGRTCFAKANVKSILLDEPTAIFDSILKKKFIKWLKKKYKCQIILATHDKNLKKYADRVIALSVKELKRGRKKRVKRKMRKKR